MLRPEIPLWSHRESLWVYKGKGYTSNDLSMFRYMQDLLKYIDKLEQQIEGGSHE
jgi:hypothetical protein